jgi:hypothetical protein
MLALLFGWRSFRDLSVVFTVSLIIVCFLLGFNNIGDENFAMHNKKFYFLFPLIFLKYSF